MKKCALLLACAGLAAGVSTSAPTGFAIAVSQIVPVFYQEANGTLAMKPCLVLATSASSSVLCDSYTDPLLEPPAATEALLTSQFGGMDVQSLAANSEGLASLVCFIRRAVRWCALFD